MKSISLYLVQDRYKELFLYGLLAATLLPACVAILNFDVMNQSLYPLVLMFSVLTVMGSVHTWLTIAYYFDRQWLAHFHSDKVVYFAAPACIVAGAILLAVQPSKPVWDLVGYGLIVFLNIWHHSRQNWGIMAMVGKLRGVDVRELRVPLAYAWLFFLVPLCLYFPAIDSLIDKELLVFPARISSILYCGFSAIWLIRSRFWKHGDRITKIFAVALFVWFLPMAFFYGKPYALFVWVAAHALQYYLFVLVSLTLDERNTISTGSLRVLGGKVLVILGALTVLAYVISVATDVTKGADWSNIAVRAMAGVFAGVNLAHFWLDAFIWRFANPKVRALHGAAFAF